jgi:hypothetical protein
MSKVFLQKGDVFTVADKESMNYLDKLPAGNFLIKFSPFTGYYFEKIESFTMEHKVYGNTNRHADRILSTFKDRPASTGVLLSGEKGSGKTLLAKRISMDAAVAEEMPTLIINTPLHGDEFNQFIQELKQPAIMLFDEFEKVYDRDQQDSILTLLDGVFASKKLFVMTCNEVNRINDYMRNRPGRIFYAINFDGLDAGFIREYCEDNLKNKLNIDSVCRAAVLFDRFNFDILKALVEEMNRYNETASEALELLNAKPYGSNQEYDINMSCKGVTIPVANLYPETINGMPLQHDNILVSISGYEDPNATKEQLEDDDYESPVDGRQNFTDEHLVNHDMVRGVYVYNNGEAVMTLTRKVSKNQDFRRFL